MFRWPLILTSEAVAAGALERASFSDESVTVARLLFWVFLALAVLATARALGRLSQVLRARLSRARSWRDAHA